MIEFLNANIFIYLAPILGYLGYLRYIKIQDDIQNRIYQIGNNFVQESISRTARLFLGQKLDFYIYLV